MDKLNTLLKAFNILRDEKLIQFDAGASEPDRVFQEYVMAYSQGLGDAISTTPLGWQLIFNDEDDPAAVEAAGKLATMTKLIVDEVVRLQGHPELSGWINTVCWRLQ